MTTYKIYWVNFAGHRTYMGTVRAANEVVARVMGRRTFGPFGNGQDVEAEKVEG